MIDGKVHLFYQTYGNGPKDAICHAVSNDGLKFDRDPSNPVFRSTGAWNSGRAIDAEVARFHDKWFLYAATRDPESKVQMLVAAVSGSGFGRGAWKMFEEGEAPAAVQHGETLFLFYGGAYNNAPQQIGCARSKDGLHWERISKEPFIPVGKPGS